MLAACIAAGALVAGCAKPAGRLFAPIDPPIVWPRAPQEARIRLVGTISDSRDLSAGRSSSEAFKAALRGPRPPIRFAGPHSVATGPGALLAVADGNGAAVHIVDLDTRTHRTITGWADQRFDVPLGVCWVGQRLFVTDAGRHEVVELAVDGTLRNRFGDSSLTRPVGIVYVASRDRIYVVDGGAHCVAVFDLSGDYVRTIGGPGTGEGEFNYPSHICWDQGTKLLVTDSGNFRIQVLNLDGECQSVFGTKGNGAGDFSLPKGVAVDSDGHVYVVDAHFENIQVFDGEGRLLLAFGREGDGLGEFWLPAGLSIDADDRIWVADSGNHRVQVFEYLGEQG